MSPEIYQISSIVSQDQAWVKEITCQRWGAEFVVVHGEIHHPWKLKGFIARNDLEEKLGLITYILDGPDCEIITLDSFVEGQGVGSALLSRVIQEAGRAGCSKVQLTTTNDNQRGIAFYRRKGFQLAAVYPGAVKRARKLKPSIPLLSPTGIPIRDELQFELALKEQKRKGVRK
jgi:GNAT superfamily N-acetyltransferase